MKDTLKAIGFIFALAGMRLADLVWWLSKTATKLAILAAILAGAAATIWDAVYQAQPAFEADTDGILAYFRLGFAVAAEAWWVLALVLLLVWVSGIWAAVRRIETHAGESKTALVALGNYFEIVVDTEGMQALREKGYAGLLRRIRDRFIASLLFGSDGLDDRLTARPVRMGSAVSLRNDLRKTLER